MIRQSTTSTLSPYTTLFRSGTGPAPGGGGGFRLGVAPWLSSGVRPEPDLVPADQAAAGVPQARDVVGRSEEHTSELQSRPHLVCRLLLETKNTTTTSSIKR